MEKLFFVIGAISAALGVIAGAFGGHTLKNKLAPEMLSVFDVAVRYHLIHSLALLAVSWACTKWPGTFVNISGYLFICGIILFSGSLYTLSISGIKWIGAITPVGGISFITGWGLLAFAIIKYK
ncbi:MAG: DUF423 domain-containing protein [Planctomycetes bacterium]|nr:DUF423 domain-containing protein [Planctomycetota bacterium]